jgi:hypothetical protein
MKLALSLFAVCFLFLTTISRAQSCMETHFSAPTQAKIDSLEGFTNEWIRNYRQNARFRGGETEIFTIPVVVHIVWREGDDGNMDENISDAVIREQIEILNKDFRRCNATKDLIPSVFQGLTADVGFEFCLDTITRTITPVKGIGSSAAIFHAALGGEDAWDTNKYFNIWVAARLDNVKGEGIFPMAAKSPEEDGVIMNVLYFGKNKLPNNDGRTLTHEVGHYFNLLHPWGKTPDCSDDDEVDDTPLQKEAHRGCPTFPQLNCDNEPEMTMNFMDYTDDACVALFTQGQKERMLATLHGPRKGLLENSTACLHDTALNLSSYIKVISNPIENGVLRLSINKRCDVKNIRLLNLLGQTMLQYGYADNLEELFVGDLSKGTYIVAVELADDSLIYKKILIL